MIERIHKLKKAGKTIGFTASTAELAHPGFIDMLLQAKKDCDFLIFGLLTDPTISRPDTKNKPVETTFERWVRLSAIKYIDMIIPFDTEEDLINMINLIQPSVRFVGEEYKGTEHTGWNLCPIIYNTRKHKWSSSSLRQKIYVAENAIKHQQYTTVELDEPDDTKNENLVTDDKPDYYVISSDNIPHDLNECFKYLDKISDLGEWLKMDENSALAVAHHGIGRILRNEWRLWSKSPLSDYFNGHGITHADDMSSMILTSFHRKRNDKKIKFTEQIRIFKNFWNIPEKDKNDFDVTTLKLKK